MNRQPVVPQLLFERLVGGHAGRIITAVPDHRVCPGFGYQVTQYPLCIAACEHQAAAGFFKRGGESGKRMVEPPFLRTP